MFTLFGSRKNGNFRQDSDYDVMYHSGINLVVEKFFSGDIDWQIAKKIGWDNVASQDPATLEITNPNKDLWFRATKFANCDLSDLDLFIEFTVNGKNHYRRLIWSDNEYFSGWLPSEFEIG